MITIYPSDEFDDLHLYFKRRNRKPFDQDEEIDFDWPTTLEQWREQLQEIWCLPTCDVFDCPVIELV